MNSKEFEDFLEEAKGEGFRAGQETKKLKRLVDNERMDHHLETGKLSEGPVLAIKIRGDNPGWTTQPKLTEDPEENLRVSRRRGKDSSETP